MYKNASGRQQRACFSKLKPTWETYELLGDWLSVLSECQHTCFLLQAQHITLAESNYMVGNLRLHLLDDDFIFKVPSVSEKTGSLDKKGKYVETKKETKGEIARPGSAEVPQIGDGRFDDSIPSHCSRQGSSFHHH